MAMSYLLNRPQPVPCPPHGQSGTRHHTILRRMVQTGWVDLEWRDSVPCFSVTPAGVAVHAASISEFAARLRSLRMYPDEYQIADLPSTPVSRSCSKTVVKQDGTMVRVDIHRGRPGSSAS
jgi:hypothetical protein